MSETNRAGWHARTGIVASSAQNTRGSDKSQPDREDSREDTQEVAPDCHATNDDTRLMTDGGHDTIDPQYLPRSWVPAIVKFCDGSESFVAHHRTKESGWLWVKNWQRETWMVPPHRVRLVERVEIETTHREQQATAGIVDDDLRRRARRKAQPTADTDQEATADD